MSMNVEQQSQLKLLIAKGKEQGYLTYREVNDHLPNDIVDPSQIEDIISMINDMGIAVHEIAPDSDSMVLSESSVSADDDVAEEAAAALVSVDSEFGRTSDPVRMYMREMGTVELLTREGEIEIAKRIEDGVNQVFSALGHFPGTVLELLNAYELVEKEESRLGDVITGFRSDDDPDEIVVNPNVVAPNPVSERDDDDVDDMDDDDDDSVGGPEDLGPDPEEARIHFDELKKAYAKYSDHVQKRGKDDKAKTLYKAVEEQFSQVKLVPKLAEQMVKNLRDLVDRVRDQERVIMDFCVAKAKMSRKDFISSFPENETNLQWLQGIIDQGRDYSAVLQQHADDILRAQRKLSSMEEENDITIGELKEINRRMSIDDAKARRA